MLAACVLCERLVRCRCGEPLARVSRDGAPAGVYPVDGVRMEYQRGRVQLFCPRCRAVVELTVAARAA